MESAFLDRMRALVPGDFDAFIQALDEPKPRHLRLNRRRPHDYDAELAESGLLTEPDETFEHVRRVLQNPEYAANTITFQTGGCYIQNPSSLYPPAVLAGYLPTNPIVLDMAAAPGGKTTAICELTDNRGLVIANEPSKKRLKALNFNLEKNGAFSAKTVSLDGRVMPDVFPDTFHGILLDAPCSNENKFFRNEEVARQWTMDLVHRMAELQRQLITRAYDCLAPGGVLVYSTCTFSVEENEDVIAHALAHCPGAELIDIARTDTPTGGGIGRNSDINDRVVRVWPHTSNHDGFFIAALRKPGEHHAPDIRSEQKVDTYPFLAEYPGLPAASFRTAGGRVFMESPLVIGTRARFDRTGMTVAHQAGKGFFPSAALVWEFGHLVPADRRVSVPREAALEYLKGFDLRDNHAIVNPIIESGGIPLGPAKTVGNTLKNKLDRYFLYGKTITW